jgi:hypothetical protein
MAYMNGVDDRAGNNTFGGGQWCLWSQHLIIVVLIGPQGSNPKLTRSRQRCTRTKGHLDDMPPKASSSSDRNPSPSMITTTSCSRLSRGPMAERLPAEELEYEQGRRHCGRSRAQPALLKAKLHQTSKHRSLRRASGPEWPPTQSWGGLCVRRGHLRSPSETCLLGEAAAGERRREAPQPRMQGRPLAL